MRIRGIVMFNRGWVIGGIIIFVAVAAFPFYWYQLGRDKPFPQVGTPRQRKKVRRVSGVYAS